MGSCLHGVLTRGASPYTLGKVIVARPYVIGGQLRTATGNMAVAAMNARPSPRIKLAARLWSTGAVKTKKEAARLAGIHPVWFGKMTNYNPQTKRLTDDIDEQLQDKSVQTSMLLVQLGREALGRIRQLSRGSSNEHVQLKAAIDLADRSPETSKVQRHEIASLNLSGADAKELAAALVAGAEVKAKYSEVVVNGYEKVEEGNGTEQKSLPKSEPTREAPTADAKEHSPETEVERTEKQDQSSPIILVK
jgi:hypothetical protein